MSAPTLNPEITIGNLVTAGSVLVSAAALGYGWWSDRRLRKREYADRIRRTAATTIAKLERWRSLALYFFEQLEPSFTEAQSMLEKGSSAEEVSLHVVKAIVSAREKWTTRVIEEEIELAYVELYGYDTNVQSRFNRAIRDEQRVGNDIYRRTLFQMRRKVIEFRRVPKAEQPRIVAELKEISETLSAELQNRTGEIVDTFSGEVEKLVARIVAAYLGTDPLPPPRRGRRHRRG